MAILIALFVVAVIVVKVYHQVSKYPEKGLWVAMLDTIMVPFRFFRFGAFKDGNISIEKIMKTVISETGLSDFGDFSFIESWKVVTECDLHKSLTYSNIGYLMAYNEVKNNLTRRVKLLDYLKKAPEVIDIPVKSPVFVFGLGRSGTTLIHRLLSLDPSVRAPKLWELAEPVPGVHWTGNNKQDFIDDREKRAAIMKGRIKQRDFLGDKTIEKFHEIDSDLPEECLHVMADEIPCSTYSLFSSLASCKVFLNGVTHSQIIKAYEWHKKVLQVLSYQIGDMDNKYRWVLKSPLHILYIKQIKEVYPDAKLIWAHRHPIPTVTSLCALLRALHGLYFDKETCDAAVLGKGIRDLASFVVKQAVQDIKETGLPCFHMKFDKLVADPIDVVRSIYKQYGWEFTPEYESILVQYLKDDAIKRANIAKKHNNQGRKKVVALGQSKKEKLHNHNPAEFNLTTEELTSGNFKEYIDLFNLIDTD